MPGKYSHSVVLADYSSRGIISLPPDQHSKYVESLPLPLKQQPSLAQLRLRGTRSAHAIYHDPRARKPGRPLPLDQRHPASGNLTVPPRHRLDVILDEVNDNDNDNAFKPMRYSRYYEQMPVSSPEINLAVQNSEPELRSAYQRQQHAKSNIESMPLSSKPATQGKGQRTGFEERLHSPVVRESNSRPSSRKVADAAAAPTATYQPPALRQASSVGARSSNTHAPPNSPASQGLSPSNLDRLHVPTFTRNIDSDLNVVFQDRSQAKSTPTEDRSQPSKRKQASSGYASNRAASSESQNAPQTRPHEPRHLQVQSPTTPILLEPDFDGFLDASPLDHPDGHRGPVVHSRDSSMNSMLPIQRPDSWIRPPSRGQHSTSTATTLPKVASGQNGDRNSPSMTTESSVKTSTRAHRSNSSVSSVSMSNSYPHVGNSKHNSEAVKKIHQSLPADQSWRLPEISEDHGFSPSIFEDKEGHQNGMKLDELDSGMTIGQISSGKDVTFDNSDAMSELSAALPPPITRFRDEEDEFNANMTRLFGDGADYAITKKGSHTIGRAATKKTKGFFSKFRSKS